MLGGKVAGLHHDQGRWPDCQLKLVISANIGQGGCCDITYDHY